MDNHPLLDLTSRKRCCKINVLMGDVLGVARPRASRHKISPMATGHDHDLVSITLPGSVSLTYVIDGLALHASSLAKGTDEWVYATNAARDLKFLIASSAEHAGPVSSRIAFSCVSSLALAADRAALPSAFRAESLRLLAALSSSLASSLA